VPDLRSPESEFEEGTNLRAARGSGLLPHHIDSSLPPVLHVVLSIPELTTFFLSETDRLLSTLPNFITYLLLLEPHFFQYQVVYIRLRKVVKNQPLLYSTPHDILVRA